MKGLLFSSIAALSAVVALAQTRPVDTTSLAPSGTPAGSIETGTINSGGVAPAIGRPAVTPTGPSAGGPGSGTTAPIPTTGRPESTPVPPATTTGGAAAAIANTRTVNENASDNAKAVQVVLTKFDSQREAASAKRKDLIEKLTSATTEADRKSIIEELRTANQEHAAEQRALAKEIRNELKQAREPRKPGSN